jgi:XRE family transcriptional regulator, regulator of sulfur utilization
MARTRSQAFGYVLRRLRKERDDMSQEAAALACRVDRAYFGKIERGEKNPTLEMIWKIADGFETTPSDLLARAERLLAEG